jgi:hypothetical protein
MKHHGLFSGSVLMIALVTAPARAAQGSQDRPAAPVQQSAGEYAPGAVAPTLTLPAGTLITVRTRDFLSSDRDQPGDTFSTLLEQPIVAQGRVVARRGQTVIGRVAIAQKAGRGSGVSQLAIELGELVLVDGQQVPIQTQLIRSSAGTSHAQDAAVIGGATGIGAAVGAAAGGGQGAAIGAAGGVLTTRGRPTEIPMDTVLTFRLEEPLTIDTTGSQQAFAPVTPGDYPASDTARTFERYRPRIYSVPSHGYYYPPYDYYHGFYPRPYGGFYPYYGYGYGFRPRIYVPPRVFVGPRFGRRR